MQVVDGWSSLTESAATTLANLPEAAMELIGTPFIVASAGEAAQANEQGQHAAQPTPQAVASSAWTSDWGCSDKSSSSLAPAGTQRTQHIGTQSPATQDTAATHPGELVCGHLVTNTVVSSWLQ